MPFNEFLFEGILESRNSPFARNKGFSERYDKRFETGVGYVASDTTILWDVRSMYGFFMWLKNNTGVLINFTVLYSYKNFTNIKSLTNDNDWVQALDSDDNPITGIINNGSEFELEKVRLTSRITAVRLDSTSIPALLDLNGVFSGV